MEPMNPPQRPALRKAADATEHPVRPTPGTTATAAPAGLVGATGASVISGKHKKVKKDKHHVQASPTTAIVVNAHVRKALQAQAEQMHMDLEHLVDRILRAWLDM